MPYTLPLINSLWPKFRILTRARWGGGGSGADNRTSGGNWIPQPMRRRGKARHGFVVLDFERVTFPQVGRARIAYDYGVFDDGVVGLADAVDELDPSTTEMNVPDLTGNEVRIQVAPAPENDALAATGWRTVYWGTVDYAADEGWPASITPAGRRIYHLVDGFYRASRWVLDRHGAAVTWAHPVSGSNISVFGHMRGHPGYNINPKADGVAAGNRNASQYTTPAGISVNYHTKPGASTSKWTDLQAAEHALHSVTPPGEPKFTFSGATDLLGAENPWRVAEGENAHAFVMRVCKRERGKGCVYVDWEDDSSDPTGPLTIKLTVKAQMAADVSYAAPLDGSTTTIQGATSRATSEAVDLTGLHNVSASEFQLGDPDQFRVGYLETLGERIEVLATLSYLDGQVGTTPNFEGRSLVRGWSAADQVAFRALTAVRRQEAKWRPVYQLHRLHQAWDGRVADGNGGATIALHRVDYRCTEDGYIRAGDNATAAETAENPDVGASTSPLLVEVLDDLPLFEGYVYTGATPARSDAAAEISTPTRRKIIGYVRLAANRYVDFDQASNASIHVSVDEDGIWVVHSGDEGAGTRFLSDTTASLSAGYNYQNLVLTVGLRLPHRVRMASGDPTAKRKAQIIVPNCHLWLSSPGAIHDLDTSTTSSGGYAARRGACGATVAQPGLLRDDRAALAKQHALAWAWFGNDTPHRSASWGMRACGFLDSFDAYSGTEVEQDGITTSVDYPTLGNVVTTLSANGEIHTLNTPITRIAYDNTVGLTRWETEWSSLEFE